MQLRAGGGCSHRGKMERVDEGGGRGEGSGAREVSRAAQVQAQAQACEQSTGEKRKAEV